MAKAYDISCVLVSLLFWWGCGELRMWADMLDWTACVIVVQIGVSHHSLPHPLLSKRYSSNYDQHNFLTIIFLFLKVETS
jgi:hypothetical protein